MKEGRGEREGREKKGKEREGERDGGFIEKRE